MIDRCADAASEGVSRTVGHAAQIEWPEADADDERVSRAGRFGQSQSDRSARRGLLVERSPLNRGNGLRASLSWIKSGNESGNKNEEGEENGSEPEAYVRVVPICFLAKTPLTTKPVASQVDYPRSDIRARLGWVERFLQRIL